MDGSRSTGARLGRAAARIWRARQSAHQAPIVPAMAQWGRAAGNAAGKRLASPSTRAPGALSTALGRGRRRLWAHCANVVQRLGLQLASVMFLFFACGFGFAGVKSWMADHVHHGMQLSSSATAMSSTTWLELGLAVLFAYFGVSSWLRAAARQR